MDEPTKAAIAAAALLLGLLVILAIASANGQKEVPDDRPQPTRAVSVR